MYIENEQKEATSLLTILISISLNRNFLSSIEIFESSVNCMRDVWSTPVNSELKTNGTTQNQHSVRPKNLKYVSRVWEWCFVGELLWMYIPNVDDCVLWRICIQHAWQLSRSVCRCIYTMPFSRCVITLVYCSQTDLDVALLNAVLYANPFLWMACHCQCRRRRRRRRFICHFMFTNYRWFAFKILDEFCSFTRKKRKTQ